MLRLFVALDLPESERERLAGLAGGVPGARWVAPENLHLTLRFVGEVDGDRAGDLDAALSRIAAPAFALSVVGVGCFEAQRRPQTLWAGVEPNPVLDRLRDKVDRAAVAAGFDPDDRKFRPHVTLARLKQAPRERVARWLAHHGLLRIGPVPVDRFVLYRSDLTADGPVYEALADYPLVRPAASATGD